MMLSLLQELSMIAGEIKSNTDFTVILTCSFYDIVQSIQYQPASYFLLLSVDSDVAYL